MRPLLNLWVVTSVCLVAAFATSCGRVVRTGTAPVLLVIDQLGPQGSTTGAPLQSSVTGTASTDLGSVTLRLVLKDLGTDGAGLLSPSNAVTIRRYRVAYRRTDGRSVQGVDVPYTFDGVVTGTIPVNGSATLSFELVRALAKTEPPLSQFAASRALLTAFADITFWGEDLVGNTLSATGAVQIVFGSWQ